MKELVSLDYIKSYFPDRSEDSIVDLSTRVTRLIEEYLRTSFDTKEYTEVYSTRTSVRLKHLPIVEVMSVTDLTTSTGLVQGTDFHIFDAGLFFPTRVAGMNDLSVTYQAGLKDVPVLVNLVAEDLIRFWAFKEGKVDEIFLSSETMEDRSYTNRNISDKVVLSTLSTLRYLPSGSYPQSKLVRIGVI